MSTAAWVWLVLIGLIGLMWLSRHLKLNGADHWNVALTADGPVGGDRVMALLPQSDSEPMPETRWPTVSVLVAAKDEEAVIAACVRSLAQQDYAEQTGSAVQIVAIDDRSSDATRQILRDLAREIPELTVVEIDELPDGWSGKNHAMHRGTQAATGEMLVFTDADCRFDEPAALRTCLGFAIEHAIELLTDTPSLERKTFWEFIVQPAAAAVLLYWYEPRKVNDPAKSNAYANGAFIAMPRTVHDALGGHESVAEAINEDLAIARRAKAAGHRLFVASQHNLYACRMYSNFSQIFNGWTRIFVGSFPRWHRLIISLVFLVLFSLGPWISLIAALIALAVGMAGAGWIALLSAAVTAFQLSVMARFYPLMDVPRRWGLTYPLAATVCGAVLVNAVLRKLGLGRTVWRGTTYAAPSGRLQSADKAAS